MASRLKLNARRSDARNSEGEGIGRDHDLLQHDPDRSHLPVARRKGTADTRASQGADGAVKAGHEAKFPHDSVGYPSSRARGNTSSRGGAIPDTATFPPRHSVQYREPTGTELKAQSRSFLALS